MAQKKKGLGRGLDALLGGGDAAEATTAPHPAKAKPRPVATEKPAPVAAPQSEPLEDGSVLVHLDPRDIRPNPKQPRKFFDEDHLQELAESIRRDGLQEPVIVRERNGEYELVSGERRVRASVLAEQDTILAICREISDDDLLMLGIIENIQREDLNPIELAEAYQELLDTYGWSHEQLADRVGKKRATVSNVLRLLQLPKDIHEHVISGALSMGHARALLAIDSPNRQSEVCRRAMREGLSVREVEKLAQSKPKSAGKASTGPTGSRKDPHVAQVEDDLRRKLGTKVQVRADAEYKGKIEIEFYDLDDLDRLLDLLR
jgi:ParB family chromosome partitioning protein